MKITLEDASGNVVRFPTKIEVCSRCKGRGVHDPRGFSNGLTSEDFADDPEFSDAYFTGAFDVSCEECHGRNVVEVPDEEHMDAPTLALLHEWYREESIYRATERAERMMGA